MNPDPNSAQGATVVLSADAKPFERALDNSVKKYQEFAAKVEQRGMSVSASFKDRAQEITKTFGNALSGGQAGALFEALKSGGIKGAAFAGSLMLVEKLVETAKKLSPIVREWEREAFRFNSTLKTASEGFARTIKDSDRYLSQLGGNRAGGAEEAKALEKRAKAVELYRKQLNDELSKINAKMAEMENASDADRIGHMLGGGDSIEEFKELTKRAEQLESEIGKLGDEAFDTSERLKRITDPDASAERRKSIDDMVKDLERQRFAIGKSADEWKVLEMTLDGFSAKQVNEVKGALDALADTKRTQKLEDELDLLRKQAELFGKSAMEAKLYDLAREGFSDAQLKRYEEEARASEAAIAAKQREMDFFKQVEEYKAEQLKIGESGLVGAASGGSSAAANAIAAARADTSRFANATPEQKAEQARQQALREQIKTVAELQKIAGQLATVVSGIEGLSAL